MKTLKKNNHVSIIGLCLVLGSTAGFAAETLNGDTTVQAAPGEEGNLYLNGFTLTLGDSSPYHWGEMVMDYNYGDSYDRSFTFTSEGYGSARYVWGWNYSSSFFPQMELDSDDKLKIYPPDGTWSSPTVVIDPGAGYGDATIMLSNNRVLTTADSASVFVPRLANNALMLSGTYSGSGANAVPATGSGTRMMWYPGKAAFRAGTVSSTQWDESNIGVASTAFGSNTRASGAYSTAFGSTVVASGSYSTALGVSTTASGIATVALGQQTIASGSYSNAQGVQSVASGSYSTAIGWQNTASGFSSVALGSKSVASGHGSYSIGIFADATALGSISLGYGGVGGGTGTQWNEDEPLFDLGNAQVDPLAPVVPATRSSAITTLKNGRTTLANKAWKDHVANAGGRLEDPPNTATDSGGDALVVDGHTRLRGKVLIEPQGDLSMSGFSGGDQP